MQYFSAFCLLGLLSLSATLDNSETSTSPSTTLASLPSKPNVSGSKASSDATTSLKNSSPTTHKTSSTKTVKSPSKTTGKKTSTSLQYASTVPDIDTCGAGSANVSCPGAGSNGYYYRCCSGAGHCGPKNSLQAQSLYCGDGCQAGYSNGKCGGSMSPPANPTAQPGTAADGDTCGPIVNKRCAQGLCCSGSNYCGTGADFCGAANWCQPQFGSCDSS